MPMARSSTAIATTPGRDSLQPHVWKADFDPRGRVLSGEQMMSGRGFPT
jgi:hypothetical protein